MFKKIYKILIVSVLFLSLMLSVNAGTTYLNSCKNSGWVANEIYVINITSITTVDCFTDNQGTDNVVITSNGQTINVANDLRVFYLNEHSWNLQFSGWKFENLTFKWNDKSLNNLFLGTGSSGANSMNNFNFNNIKIINGGRFIYFLRGGTGSDPLSFNNWYLNNINFNGLDFYKSYGFITDTANTFIINNSLIISDDFIDVTPLGTQYSKIKSQYVDNTILIINTTSSLENTVTTINYYNSLLKGFSHLDTDNNNIADTDLFTGIFNSKINIIFDNKKYIQDFNEGLLFINNNEYIIPINDETLGTDTLGTGAFDNNTYDFSYVNYIFNNRNVFNFNLASSNIYNSFICPDKISTSCYLSDVAYNSVTSGIYRPFFAIIGGGVQIDRLNLNKQNPNNANMIANELNSIYTNIIIKNTIFNKFDGLNKTQSLSTSNELIKLKANNVKIYNNTFKIENGASEIISLIGTIPTSNKIYLNNFSNIGLLTNHEIFTTGTDTLYYNNYIDNGINISDTINVNNMNNLIPYEHSNGKIYYFPVGNYYKSNTGCVDNDVNGFCDSPYTSGIVTDNYPLSSYPFDYIQHLFTAVKVVDNTLFNITTLVNNNILNNDINVNVVDVNSVINLSFYHNSVFPDLTCDYVVNGVKVNNGTILNPNQSQTYTISVKGWNVGLSSYRVECFNDFGIKLSNEYNLNINYNGGGGNTTNGGGGNTTNGGGGNTINGGGSSSTPYSSIDVIDYNSVDNTNANTIGFMQDIIGFVTNVGIPLGILLVVIISVFAVLRLLM